MALYAVLSGADDFVSIARWSEKKKDWVAKFLDLSSGVPSHVRGNAGLLSRFVGMLTDSRSFMSFPRHEYFRRCLCDLLGEDIRRGALPDDDSLLGPMIRGICYGNARDYLALGVE